LTNIEHRIQKLNPALPPPGEARPDWSILEEILRALGKPMGYFTAADVFREMTVTIPFYKGLRRRDLEGDGRITHPFTTAAERLRGGKPYSFAPVRTLESPADPDSAEYPFEMIAGRTMFHFGSTSTRSANLRLLTPRGELEVNEEDAIALGVVEGDVVTVSSSAGSFDAPVKVSANVPKGIVFAPTNFPDMGVYRLLQENTTVCNVKLVRRT